MAERIWDKFLTERDKVFHDSRGFGATAGFGKRPALLIIDVNYAFCGDKREPIMESVKTWPTSCGEDAWDALPVLARVIDVARGQGVPVMLGCDSVIVAGTTTSGCVRGTVIDSFSYNFRTAVIEDGCFDRSQASHAINLFDMHAKYADVVSSDEVIGFLKTLPAGQYELPSGMARS